MLPFAGRRILQSENSERVTMRQRVKEATLGSDLLKEASECGIFGGVLKSFFEA